MKTNIFKSHNAGSCKWNTFSQVRMAFILLLPLCLAGSKQLKAQGVAINITGAPAKSSAVLDLSTGNGGKYGFLAPKVALQGTNVSAPVTAPSNGLLVYDTVNASSGVDTVSQGFYYWNSGTWCRLIDNGATTPYGNNTQYIEGTTADSVSSIKFQAMPGMSITFTPVHSVVFVTFSAPCWVGSYSGLFGFGHSSGNLSGQIEVLKGATVVGAASASIGIYNTNIYGSSGFYIHIPVTVTPGVSTTISIDWRATIINSNLILNYLTNAGGEESSHATLFIND